MLCKFLLAHTEGGVPNLIVETSGRTPADLGQLIYFFEYACGLSELHLPISSTASNARQKTLPA